MVVTFPPGAANDAHRAHSGGWALQWGGQTHRGRAFAQAPKERLEYRVLVAIYDDHTLLYSVAASVTVAPL